MKKFGLKRKEKGDSRSESPANSNPYAQAPAADPYIGSNNTPPPAYNSGGGPGGFRQDKSAGNASGYGAPSPPVNEGGSGQGRYGAPAAGGAGYGGYGQGGSRYGSSEGGGAPGGGSRYGGGGLVLLFQS
jgi:hypothetical protein